MEFKTWIETQAKYVFVLLTGIQAIFLLSLFAADVTMNLSKQEESSLDDYYKWSLLFFFQFSEAYYVYVAIYKANVLELFAFIVIEFVTFCAAAVRFITLAIAQQNQIGETVFNSLYLVYALSLIVLSIVCYKPFYDVFLYQNIMKVGASLEQQKLYKDYRSFDTLIKLYFQISLSTFLTFFFFFDWVQWFWYIVDIIAILLQLLFLYYGYTGLKRENKTFVYIYFGGIIVIQLYILLKTIFFIFDTAYYNTNPNENSDPYSDFDEPDMYTNIIIGLTTLACIVLLILDSIYAFKCIDAFGKGLKETLRQSLIEKNEQELESSSFN